MSDSSGDGRDTPSDDSESWQDRADRALGRLVDASAAERILISFAALGLSVVVGALIVIVSGWVATCDSPFVALAGVGSFCYDPISVYRVMLVGAVWPPYNFAITLKETTLLLFTGLSVAVAFRAGMFNIGTQGQLLLGALGTALSVLWVAPFVPVSVLGGLLLIAIGLLVGALIGGLWGALPGALKAYADANEVITTIMLNFVATGIAFTLVSEVFKDPQSQTVQTRSIPAFAQLQAVFFDSTVFSTFALVGALALVGGVYWMLNGTSFGFDLRTSGVQPDAAEYGGVDSKRMMVSSMTVSGALAGLGGAVYVLMVASRWQTGIPSLGFDGITVSILAGNNPLGVIPAALLFGALKTGSLAIEFQLAVPKELVGVLRGLIILFIAMPEFFRMVGARLGLGDERRTVAADGGETGRANDGGSETDETTDGTTVGDEGGDER
ncbi:ABC transporter permease [Halorussus gelatinilyticus]|uniref:ABC transporter permease n=1 Tax=Halorussus gelatinilyticus TaxID=2937524 RepID=A0A8U0IET7_9EURY|nr:ABC transporter permease [Halorussus gelatinilyticus]UPV99579.1 ABC transporter permease [Halorussus gelatinilyticus]